MMLGTEQRTKPQLVCGIKPLAIVYIDMNIHDLKFIHSTSAKAEQILVPFYSSCTNVQQMST